MKAILKPSLGNEAGELAMEIKIVEYLKSLGRPAHAGTHVGRYCLNDLQIDTAVSPGVPSPCSCIIHKTTS